MQLKCFGTAVLAAVSICCASASREPWLSHALASRDCATLVAKQFFIPPGDLKAWRAAWRCEESLQRPILESALQRNDCAAVAALPGFYPYAKAPAEQKRFVYHCRIDASHWDFDFCGLIGEVGDSTSVPRIEKVLDRYEPTCDQDGCSLIDTAWACVGSLQQIEHLSDSAIRARMARRGGSWAVWATKPQS